MMVMSGCFLPGRDDLVGLLERYHAFWQRGFASTNYADSTGYDGGFGAMAPELARRFATVRSALSDGDLDALPGLLRRWAAHCTELRGRVTELAGRGELTFRALESDRDLRVTSPEAALTMLASPYLHMTNNRLSVTIRDEAYLSYVLARALREPAAGRRGP